MAIEKNKTKWQLNIQGKREELININITSDKNSYIGEKKKGKKM